MFLLCLAHHCISHVFMLRCVRFSHHSAATGLVLLYGKSFRFFLPFFDTLRRDLFVAIFFLWLKVNKHYVMIS